MKPRDYLKQRLWREHGCEAHGFCRDVLKKKHICNGGPNLNEVFITKGHVQKMSTKKKKYINHELNCATMCQQSHMDHGHSKKFRKWFAKQQVERHGELAMIDYLANSPQKVKSSLGYFL